MSHSVVSSQVVHSSHNAPATSDRRAVMEVPMKYEMAERLMLAIEEAVEKGCEEMRVRAALAAQALCCADDDHDDHDDHDEEEPTVH
jgi:hypothetical protein